MTSLSHLDVRRLNEKDINLAFDAIELFSNVYAQNLKAPNREHIKRLLARSEFVCIGAVLDDQVIGGLTAYILPSLYHKLPEIFIYDIAVIEAYQRRGIGQRLFEKLKPFANDLRIKKIFVEAPEDNERVLAFYRKLEGQEVSVHKFVFDA